MFSDSEKRVIEEYKALVDSHHRSTCPFCPQPERNPLVNVALFYIGSAAVFLVLFLVVASMGF